MLESNAPRTYAAMVNAVIALKAGYVWAGHRTAPDPVESLSIRSEDETEPFLVTISVTSSGYLVRWGGTEKDDTNCAELASWAAVEAILTGEAR